VGQSQTLAAKILKAKGQVGVNIREKEERKKQLKFPVEIFFSSLGEH
jgi:hypothetical protein